MRGRMLLARPDGVREIADFAPTETLLDHLRLRERACGTKEGCAEGDCGACTVIMARLEAGRLALEPVNSCITLLGQMDGKGVITVEDLGTPERLHPVQEALVRHHGSQCGFCTPGIVVSLFALYETREGEVGRATVKDWLAGNLCRCTGYRPIVDAAVEACGTAGEGAGTALAGMAEALSRYGDPGDLFVGDSDRFFAALASLDAAAELAEAHPDAVLLGGATDVGLWITKGLKPLAKIIHLGRVPELKRIAKETDRIVLGAGVTYAASEEAVRCLDPDLGALWRRLGSKQIRALGTIGGNIANGSPIGDTPPALIALEAGITLRKGSGERSLPLEAFFIDYGCQDRAPGEILKSVEVPRLGPDQHFRCYKITKRFDEDISAVTMAVRLTVEAGRIIDARIACGGMAPIPKRAREAEGRLVGAILDEAAGESAAKALSSDFAPISDHRASAAYRMEVARNLLRKAVIEIGTGQSAATRLIDPREGPHATAA